MALPTKPKRRRGRPLKEESNAIAVEKAVMDGNTELIKLIPKAYEVLKNLLNNPATKDNILAGVAKYVIEKGDDLDARYKEEDDDADTDKITQNKSETGVEPTPMRKPFTTDIISA